MDRAEDPQLLGPRAQDERDGSAAGRGIGLRRERQRQHHELVGADIMRDILLELDKLDDIAFQELGYDSWSEENQRSDKNNPYVYQGVMDVLRRHKHKVGKFTAK